MTTQTQKEQFGIKVIIKGLKDIFKHSAEYKGSLVFILALIIISSVVDAVNPYIWGKVVDSINSGKMMTVFGFTMLEAFVILAGYFVLIVIQSIADLNSSLKSRWVEQNIWLSYTSKGFAHVFKLPLGFHKSVKSGETSEKIRSAAQAIDNILSNAVLTSLPQIITALVMYFFVIFTNSYMGIVVTIALFLYLYLSIKEITPTVALQKQMRKGYSKASGMVQDALTNIRSVKDFNTEEYEHQRIEMTYRNEWLSIWHKLFRIQRGTSAIQNWIRITVRAAVLIISIYLITKHQMTIGAMLAYNTYALMIFSPLSQIINNWRNIQNGIVAIEDSETILGTEKEAYVPANAKNPVIEGNISFKNASFYYDIEKPVLNHLNFEVHQGETVALVGESGVGKSTLIDLLLAYHFPTEGEVLIDRADTREINLNTLRQNIAVVSQEISLFNDTIKNNLAYGSFDKTDDEIMSAARRAHCVDFIDKFPEKYEQVVGEKGLKLSVGQKQRVAIARAILKNPKILILDEPTSALDAGSEKIITDSLNELMKGRTTFIVAHRLSTVRRADVILVFKDGEIIEKGKHADLLKIEGGEYRRLHELQIGLHE
jgi:ABC-type multidrug transport system fused ATPase/permease subunit